MQRELLRLLGAATHRVVARRHELPLLDALESAVDPVVRVVFLVGPLLAERAWGVGQLGLATTAVRHREVHRQDVSGREDAYESEVDLAPRVLLGRLLPSTRQRPLPGFDRTAVPLLVRAGPE